MGMMLPPRDSPAEQVRTLMARKENIEAELDAQLSILQANSSTMSSPLVDPEGFPRADIDVWAVRHARVRIIELRNDLSALRDIIMVALQNVYDPAAVVKTERSPAQEAPAPTDGGSLRPFAKVNGVAPNSPAAVAGLIRDDLILSFGSLVHSSFTASSLQPLAELVAAQEGVLRAPGQTVTLTFVPRSGWGGRGLLGCPTFRREPSGNSFKNAPAYFHQFNASLAAVACGIISIRHRSTMLSFRGVQVASLRVLEEVTDIAVVIRDVINFHHV
ncbi:predicted protein [Postia placenta Mad-698-R]|nr:predicted protein [Postia placenta Mad-698-R]